MASHRHSCCKTDPTKTSYAAAYAPVRAQERETYIHDASYLKDGAQVVVNYDVHVTGADGLVLAVRLAGVARLAWHLWDKIQRLAAVSIRISFFQGRPGP